MPDLRFALRTRSIGRTYGDDAAVVDVNLDVRFGEIHALVGLNGAGKTTLMRLLLGMVRPTSGVAELMDSEVESVDSEVWRHVGTLIETPFSYPELTVRENLVAAALLHGLDRSNIPTAVDTSIDKFGLGKWANKRSRVLSLGNQQRLGLASATLHHPTILVLDEPANALDPAGVVFIRDLLREYSQRGAAVLVSSHHLDQVARVANRISLLHRGRIIGNLDPGGADLERQFFDRVYEFDRVEGVV